MTTKVLLVGSGAREHAIAKSLRAGGAKLFSYMNFKNPGIARLSANYNIGKIGDIPEITDTAKKFGADFVVVGPEEPLARGVVDALLEAGIPSVGPLASLARLESSKSFARTLIEKHRIAGANPKFMIFQSTDGMSHYVETELHGMAVVKPDGLTGGKGVRVLGEHLHDTRELVAYCDGLFSRGENTVVLEERMDGEEYVLQCFVDGNVVVPMPLVQDHKRAFDGDVGPNTGGMGAYSCGDRLLPFVNSSDFRDSLEIMRRVVSAAKKETGFDYKGVLYGQFMLTREGPKIVEFNSRFGDPEAMNVLSILDSSFVNICERIIDGTLRAQDVEFTPMATVCTYLVPEGYPDTPVVDEPIEVPSYVGENLFCASVYEKDGTIYTTRSRSLAAVGIAETVGAARELSLDIVSGIGGKLFYRTDIGSAELIKKRVAHVNRLKGIPERIFLD